MLVVLAVVLLKKLVSEGGPAKYIHRAKSRLVAGQPNANLLAGDHRNYNSDDQGAEDLDPDHWQEVISFRQGPKL